MLYEVITNDEEKSAIQALINSKDYTGLAEYMGDDAQTLGIRILSDPEELLYAQVRAVETGIEDAYYVEIKSGLSEGDSVLQPAASNDDSSGFKFNMDMGAMNAMSGDRQMPPGGVITSYSIHYTKLYDADSGFAKGGGSVREAYILFAAANIQRRSGAYSF